MEKRTVEPAELDQTEADAAMFEKVRAEHSGPRVFKEPGTPDWCWQTIKSLETSWKFFETSSGRYFEAMALAKEFRVWETVPEGKPFGSKEKMVAMLEIGDEKAATERLRRDALKAIALREPGRPAKDEKHVPAHVLGTGRSDYLVARIARDAPDVLERMKQGEFKSAAEAARAAGIVRKQTKSVSLGDNVERLASKLETHYTPEQFTELSRRMLQLRRQRRRNG